MRRSRGRPADAVVFEYSIADAVDRARFARYDFDMTKVVEAIYVDGVLQPVEHLELPDRQRVRLIVQTIDGVAAAEREAAFAQFVSGARSMNFRSTGPMPKRDELHDRA